MTPEDTLQLHTCLLLTLHAVGEVGIQEAAILPRARLEAFRDLTAPQLAAALRTLADRQQILAYQPAIGGPRWKLTGLGRAALQEAGLA